MQTTQQLADLQTAIKKTLHSAAFAKFMGQAVQTAMAEAEPASGAVVLLAQPVGDLRFHEGIDFRFYEKNSKNGARHVRMMCERTPKDARSIGIWYGTESRTDSEGREWTHYIGRMVQDDFGMLVKVPA
jgi:hypothetical protein